MRERGTAKAASFWRDEEGSALVEATIVMPLLLSLFLGVFEFSWFFYNQQLVVSGLRDAARYMTRIELTDGNRDPCAQKDQYGALYTDDAANIATTAQATGRLGARQRLERGRCHHQLHFERRARKRKLRRRLDKHDDHRSCDPLRRSVARAVCIFGAEGADAVLLPSRAVHRPGLTIMSSFIARLARDEDGGPLVEVAIILPILILFLFGGIDFMNALYQWNAAAKAVEIGARIAAVSDPIASGLTSIANECAESRPGVGKSDARLHRRMRRRRIGLRMHERRMRRNGRLFGRGDGAHRLWASRK